MFVCASWLQAMFDEDTPFSRIAKSFFQGNDDQFRDSRFKLIPRVRAGRLFNCSLLSCLWSLVFLSDSLWLIKYLQYGLTVLCGVVSDRGGQYAHQDAGEETAYIIQQFLM